MRVWSNDEDQTLKTILSKQLEMGKSYGEAFEAIASELNVKTSAVKKRWYDNLRHTQKQEINNAIKTKAINQKMDRLRKRRREHINHISKIDQTLEQLKNELNKL